jgi:hypothetical protein
MRWEEERIAVPEPLPVSIEHIGVQFEQEMICHEVQTSVNNILPNILHDASAQFPSTLISPAVSMHSRAASPIILIEDDINQAPKVQVMNYYNNNFMFIPFYVHLYILFSLNAGGCTAARYKR